jgi:hypothetical protein
MPFTPRAVTVQLLPLVVLQPLKVQAVNFPTTGKPVLPVVVVSPTSVDDVQCTLTREDVNVRVVPDPSTACISVPGAYIVPVHGAVLVEHSSEAEAEAGTKAITAIAARTVGNSSFGNLT